MKCLEKCVFTKHYLVKSIRRLRNYPSLSNAVSFMTSLVRIDQQSKFKTIISLSLPSRPSLSTKHYSNSKCVNFFYSLYIYPHVMPLINLSLTSKPEQTGAKTKTIVKDQEGEPVSRASRLTFENSKSQNNFRHQ